MSQLNLYLKEFATDVPYSVVDDYKKSVLSKGYYRFDKKTFIF